MKRKNLTIILSLLTLLSTTTFVVSGLSLAWIKWNSTVDNTLTLKSGTDVLTVEFYSYLETTVVDSQGNRTLKRVTAETTEPDAYFKKDKDGYVHNATTGTITQSKSPDGSAIVVDYNPVFTPDILDFYLDETSTHYDPLPKLFFEIRYIKEISNGYLKGNIIYIDTKDDNGNVLPPSNLFQYRVLPTTKYLTNGKEIGTNTPKDYECSLAQGHLAMMNGTGIDSPILRKPFFNSSPVAGKSTIPLFDKSDVCYPSYPEYIEGSTAGNYSPSANQDIELQCFVPSYKSQTPNASHYSKASLIEICLDEEAFKKEALAKLAEGGPININMSFTFDFEFSNSPYYVPKGQ